MKKKIVLGSILLILLVSIVVAVLFLKKTNLEYQIEAVKEIDYMVFMENNKFGVINKTGDVVVKPLYDEIQIPNPSKPLFICMYDYDKEKNQYNVKVYNEKNEQILYQYVNVEAIKLNTAISNVPYEKSVLKFKENDKYGLIDFQGKVIVKPMYEDIQSFNYNEGLLLVKKNNKYGVININGVTVVKNKYDVIESDAYYEDGAEYKKSGFIVGNLKNNSYVYGYLDCKGKKVLDVQFNQIERIENKDKNDNIYIVAFKDEKAGFYIGNKNVVKHEYEDIGYDSNINSLILQKDSKQGISDLSGNIIIDIKYDNIFSSGKFVNAQSGQNVDIIDFSSKEKIDLKNIVGINATTNDDYAIAITNEENYKIFNCSENKLQEEEYEYLQYIYDNYFIASKNGKYGIIDNQGNKKIDFIYDAIQKIPNTKIVQAVVSNKNKINIICEDEIIATMFNCEVYLKNNYIVIQSDDEIKYIDFEGNITNYSDLTGANLHAIKQGKKWGFANKNNDIIIDANYDYVTEFNEYGFAGIKKDGKWGSINLNGDIIVEPIYRIDSNNPKFVGKYYEYDLGYGEPYFVNEDTYEKEI